MFVDGETLVAWGDADEAILVAMETEDEDEACFHGDDPDIDPDEDGDVIL